MKKGRSCNYLKRYAPCVSEHTGSAVDTGGETHSTPSTMMCDAHASKVALKFGAVLEILSKGKACSSILAIYAYHSDFKN